MDRTDEMAVLGSPPMDDSAPFLLAAGCLAAAVASGDDSLLSQFPCENAAHQATTDDTTPRAFGQTHSAAAQQMTAAVMTMPTHQPPTPSVDPRPLTAVAAHET